MDGVDVLTYVVDRVGAVDVMGLVDVVDRQWIWDEALEFGTRKDHTGRSGVKSSCTDWWVCWGLGLYHSMGHEAGGTTVQGEMHAYVSACRSPNQGSNHVAETCRTYCCIGEV